MEKIWLKHYPKEVSAEIDADSYPSLVEVFEEAFHEHQDREAFYSLKRALTYRQIDTLSRQFANYLRCDLGLQKGDVVAVMMPNCLQYPIALIGILRAGMVVTNINPLYTARELAHQINDSGAKTILIMENFASTLQQVLAQTPIKNIITTKLADMQKLHFKILINFAVKYVKRMVPAFDLPNTVDFLDTLKLGARHQYVKQEVNNEDIAFLQYTGGTTGVAKGAVLTHRNMVANLLQMDVWAKPRLDEIKNTNLIMISPLPMYHIFCMTVNILAFLKIGGLNVLISNPRDTGTFLKTIRKFRFHAISSVNTLFNQMINHPAIHQCDFSELKLAIGGGAAIQESVAKKWHEITGQPILEGYGMTETAPLVSTSPVIDIPIFNNSIGIPISSTEVSIRDEDGNELPIGEVGELCVKGPQVMRGYWNKPEETEKAFTKDGFLRTGDIGQMDERGYLKLVDRKKDMIIVSGFNVYPNEIENVLALHPKILESAAIGVPSEKTGEAVKVFITLKEGVQMTEEEVLEHCKANLTNYKRPKIVEFHPDLPKSPIGKILRKDLR